TLIPQSTKVVCLSEAATSELMDFETTGKVMVIIILHPTKVVYLTEDDLDITAEPSDNEENVMENSTMKCENSKSGRYKISKLEKYLSYLKQHISIVASLQNRTCKNSLQEYKARKVEIKSHLQEDWMKIVKKEDIAKAKQDFKVIFNAAVSLKSSINERFWDIYDDDLELWEIDLVDQEEEVKIKLDEKFSLYKKHTQLLNSIMQNTKSVSKFKVLQKIHEKNTHLQKELEDTFNLYETITKQIAEIEERQKLYKLVYSTQKNEYVEVMKLINDSFKIFTKISDIFAQENMAKEKKIKNVEMCEKAKVLIYEEIPILVVNYGYENSMEEDISEWSQMFEKPTIYKCKIVFQEKTENYSNSADKKNVKMNRLPKLQVPVNSK
ncbi:unnamed protein product, partial [Meganyctiphanes norvegica]